MIRFLDRAAGRAAALLFLAVMLLSLYTLYDSLYLCGHTGKAPGAQRQSAAGNPDDLPENAIARLTLTDTSVDHPVMQGADNEEYLNRDPSGEYSIAGSLFLDCRNSPEFEDDYNLIYGHHMSAGRMFGALDQYQDGEYFKSHRTGTLAGNRLSFDLTVFAVMRTDAGEHAIFDAGEEGGADRALGCIRRQALIFEEPASLKILAMSTCASSRTTDRLVVFAAMSPSEGKE